MANIAWYILSVVEVLCSILLIAVILVQRTKSQGMGMAFGSQVGENLFGAQMGNVLTKTTVILGIVFLLNTTFLALLAGRQRPRSLADGIKSAVGAVPAAAAPLAPQAGQPMEAGTATMPSAPATMPTAPEGDVPVAPTVDVTAVPPAAPVAPATPVPTVDVAVPVPTAAAE